MRLRAREWPIVTCLQSQTVDTLYQVVETVRRGTCKAHCNDYVSDLVIH